MNILTIQNSKTVKGEKYGYLTAICYLAPADMSGFNVCAHASPNCKAECLNTAGRGKMRRVQAARLRKTLLFFKQKNIWMAALTKQIAAIERKAKRQLMLLCIRLNGTSDLPWERIKIDGKNIMELYPHIQFYDYTKDVERMILFLNGKFPPNYHLTFSRSEINDADVQLILNMGGNVAILFANKPDTYLGFKVINGDESDLRFIDPKNVVVALKPKGKARKNKSSFTI
jgi:hypothetical protein